LAGASLKTSRCKPLYVLYLPFDAESRTDLRKLAWSNTEFVLAFADIWFPDSSGDFSAIVLQGSAHDAIASLEQNTADVRRVGV